MSAKETREAAEAIVGEMTTVEGDAQSCLEEHDRIRAHITEMDTMIENLASYLEQIRTDLDDADNHLANIDGAAGCASDIASEEL